MLLRESVEELRTDDAKGQELNLNGSNSGRELEGLLPQPLRQISLGGDFLGLLDLPVVVLKPAFRDHQANAGWCGLLADPLNYRHRGYPHRLIATYFVSRYSSIPSAPPSRPQPECLMPPKGAAPFETTP